MDLCANGQFQEQKIDRNGERDKEKDLRVCQQAQLHQAPAEANPSRRSPHFHPIV
jgi:hypothetical protein